MNLRCLRLFSLVLLILMGCSSPPRPGNPAGPLKGAVAAGHPLAVQAGEQALAAGGNAIDAALAAALTLGVVDGYNSGIGGGCFILVRRSDGSILALDGRETAPGSASVAMYQRNGKIDPDLSLRGALAVATPGALAAYSELSSLAGRLPLADLLRPAADLAERGFRIDLRYHERLRRHKKALGAFPPTAAIFLDGRGEPWPAGHRLRQADLASSYRALARAGIDWFYKGTFAHQAEQWMQSHGGLLTAADLSGYRTRKRRPLLNRLKNYTLVGFPPPSSGGLHVAQILSILQNYDLSSFPPAVQLHLFAEAEKLAFADRAYWLGDPDFTEVPQGLLDPGYLRQRSSNINPHRVTEVTGEGQPPRQESDLFSRHTAHISAADSAGNWVAMTTTLNTSFGSKVVIPGTGILLNNQMDDFSAGAGQPNAYGLIGAKANSIEAGKRPLSSMSPTLILDSEEQPLLAIGAAGGPTIISQVALALMRHRQLGFPLALAVADPRVHHQWRPDRLLVEDALPPAQIRHLESLGHKVVTRPHFGISMAVFRNHQDQLQPIIDPRLHPF